MKLDKLLKTGNFTLIYWDNGSGALYKGRLDIGDIDEDTKAFAEFDSSNEKGYLPEIVELLVTALGGNADSI